MRLSAIRTLSCVSVLFWVLITGAPVAPAQTYTWDGGNGANGNWSNAENWSTTGNPNAAITSSSSTQLILTGTTNTATVLDAGVPTSATGGVAPALEIRSLTFDSGAGAFTVTPGSGAPAIRLIGGSGAGLFNQSANAQTVSATLTTNGTGNVAVGNTGTGLLTLNGPIQLGGAGFSFTGNGNIDLNGVVSGGGNGVQYNGTGTVTLTAANTYGGLTLIGNTNTVKLSGGDNRLPTGTTVQFNAAGRIDLNGQNQQVQGLTTFVGANARVVNTAAGAAPTFTVAPTAGSAPYAGTFGDTGGNNFNLRLAATGGTTFTSTAAHTYTGTTTIQSGTLALSGSASFANSPTILVGAATGSGAELNTTGLTGGLNHNGGFAPATGQTLAGFSRVNGGVLVRFNSTIQGGNGLDLGTLTMTGGRLRVLGGPNDTGGTIRVVVRDTSGTVTNSLLTVAGTNELDFSNVFTGVARFRIDVRNGGGLQLGTEYSQTIVQTPSLITRNSSAVGASYTFDAGDYQLVSPDFAGFSNVSLRTSADGTDLILTFTPVPEPATVFGVTALGWLGIRSLRRRSR